MVFEVISEPRTFQKPYDGWDFMRQSVVSAQEQESGFLQGPGSLHLHDLTLA
jgi:hypothetical protein